MVAYRQVTFILLLSAISLQAQENRYIVHFKDKLNTPYSIDEPEQFLSSKSLDRRDKQQIPVLQEDLPVNPSYITGVKNSGAKTFFSSRWLNCLLIEADPVILPAIQALPYVSKTELVAPGKRLTGGRIRKWKSKSGSPDAAATVQQLQLIGLDEMQLEGFRGENLTIAVFDSGFPGVNFASPFQPLFLENRLKFTYNFVANTSNVYQYDDHGTEVFSVMAADTPEFTGGAYKANFILFITEDVTSEYRIEEFNWLFAAEKADSAGVDIINSSVGYNLFDDSSMNYTSSSLDGKTAIVTQAATKAISKGMVVLCSAGNEGSNSWKFVTPPADASGILAVGSVTEQEARSNFSSIGPSADGRIKPDVMALGSGTAVVKSNGSIGSNSGTSFASPLVASLAAGVWQAFPFLSAVEIYESIVKSADQYNTPDTQKGYGLPHFRAIKNYIESGVINEEITVHPNPLAGDSIAVTLKNPKGDSLSIIVYDLQGRIMTESTHYITWENNPIYYNLSGLGPGMYFIKAISGSSSKIFRIVKL